MTMTYSGSASTATTGANLASTACIVQSVAPLITHHPGGVGNTSLGTGAESDSRPSIATAVGSGATPNISICRHARALPGALDAWRVDLGFPASERFAVDLRIGAFRAAQERDRPVIGLDLRCVVPHDLFPQIVEQFDDGHCLIRSQARQLVIDRVFPFRFGSRTANWKNIDFHGGRHRSSKLSAAAASSRRNSCNACARARCRSVAPELLTAVSAAQCRGRRFGHGQDRSPATRAHPSGNSRR